MALNRDRLEKAFRKLRKSLKRFPDKPSPDEVHDLRTAIRRLEAMMQALKLDTTREGRLLLKAASPVRRKAGQVRDMDVLTDLASSLNSNLEGDCRVQLLEHLGFQRHRAAQKLHKSVSSRQNEARKRLKDYSTFVAKEFRQSEKDSSSEREWPTDAAATVLRVSSELAKWPPLKPNNLHAFRLKVKELRYVLQLADRYDEDFVSTLGAVKDAIGEWHDWTELAAVAAKVLGHGHECVVLKQIHSNADTKLDQAISLAVRMRRKYLGIESKPRSTRRRKPASIKRPVLSTAAKLAA
jgi:CHAD domain-containing protein